MLKKATRYEFPADDGAGSDGSDGTGGLGFGNDGSTPLATASYSWLADGTKLKVADADGNGYTHLSSLTYKRSADGTLKLESTSHGSGRIVVKESGSNNANSSENSGNNPSSSGSSNGSGGSGSSSYNQTQTYENQYFITDHLGSVRVVFNQSGEVLARNDYYPFGKPHDNPALITATIYGSGGSNGATSISTEENRFLFNGKEKQLPGDLNFLDFGARMYDPEIARWHNPDPLARKYCRWSPYNYSIDNPVRFVDPNGKKIVDAKGNLLYKNGQWTKYASNDVKRLGNSLLTTRTGREQFNKLVNHSAKIQLVLDKKGDGIVNGKKANGKIDRKLSPNSTTGTYTLKSAIITIFEKNVIETAGRKGISSESQFSGAMGHEVGHTSEENLKMSYENRYLEGNNDLEEGPNEIMNEIIGESEDNEPILKPGEGNLRTTGSDTPNVSLNARAGDYGNNRTDGFRNRECLGCNGSMPSNSDNPLLPKDESERNASPIMNFH